MRALDGGGTAYWLRERTLGGGTRHTGRGARTTSAEAAIRLTISLCSDIARLFLDELRMRRCLVGTCWLNFLDCWHHVSQDARIELAIEFKAILPSKRLT